MSNVTVFENEMFGSVRVVEINGEPWFVGKDVATALGYAKQEEQNKHRELEQTVSEMEPKVDCYNRMIDSEELLTITTIAKSCCICP